MEHTTLVRKVHQHSAPPTTGILQRKCACGNHTVAGSECEACANEKGVLQRRAAGGQRAPTEVPPIVHEVLRSPGQPLDPATRAYFEPRFGHDFSQVRIHTDTRAAESARAVNALAFTVGPDVVFGTGQYRPDNQRGRFVLAHELTHVIQQGNKDGGRVGIAPKQYEAEAHAAAWSAISGQRPSVHSRMAQQYLQKLDLTLDSLSADDIDPQVAMKSDDYIDNNIDDVGLREEWSGLSVRFIAVTVKYRDGSLIDIPINGTYLQSAKSPAQIQIRRFRKHTSTGKIVPVTWRGNPEELPETPGGPLGSVIFAKDITPNIMQGYDNALIRRAFAFSGEIGAIWGAALGARGLVQMFSATQAASIAAAGRSALGAGTASAQAAARREAERQALQAAEKKAVTEAEKKAVTEAEKKAVTEAEKKAVTEAEKKAVTEAEKKAVTEAEKKAVTEAEKKAVTEAEKKAVTEAEKKAVTEAEKKGVEIVDSQGKPIGEFDRVLKDRFIEDKSAKGLGTLHPKTGLPIQTADEWAKRQIFDKTVTRIENLLNKATATRPTKGGSPTVPSLSEIRGIRHLQFKIEAATQQVKNAVEKQLTSLRAKYPGWTFTAIFGP